jgi:hypothetical protein
MTITWLCRPSTRALLLTGSVLCAAPSGAATLDWVNLSSGDWFEPANWSDTRVPVAGDTAVVNNGGTAEASGAAAPIATTLSVGVGSGSISGTVITTTADLALGAGSSALGVGVATDPDARATGTLAVGGSIVGIAPELSMGTFRIGQASGDKAQAEGTVSVAGDMAATFGVVGALGTGSDQTATGSLTVGGSLSGLAFVGAGFGAENAAVDGAVTVTGGDLTLTTNVFVIGEALGAGTVANGAVDVQTREIRTASGLWVIGNTAQGGQATGRLQAAGVDAAGAALNGLIVGFANDGAADGTLALGAGDLRVAGNVSIGTAAVTEGATAQGDATLQGALVAEGAGRSLSVGRASGQAFQTGAGEASGTLSAEGVVGFRQVTVGAAVGGRGLGLEATGTLTVGADGIENTVDPGGLLRIGFAGAQAINNVLTGPGPVADGSATVNGDVDGFVNVVVGRVENAGTATGLLALGGGTLTTAVLDIGSVQQPSENFTVNGAATAAASGRVEVTDGRIVVTNPASFTASLTQIGTVLATGQVLDQTAEGALVLTGSGFEGEFVRMGFGAGADGTLTATDSEIALGVLGVGGQGGAARVTLTDSTLAAAADAQTGLQGDVFLGGRDSRLQATDSSVTLDGNLVMLNNAAAGDQASMAMTGGTLSVGGNVGIGSFQPGSRGELSLSGTEATVGGDLRVGRSANLGTLFGEALLHLDGSLMDVTGGVWLDVGGELSFGVGGLGRGLGGYGALEAEFADLQGGTATVDFGGLSSQLGFQTADFDLISVLSGFSGDFGLVSILNAPTGYLVSHGFFSESNGDVWRVTLSRDVAAIPLPAGAWLLLTGLAGLGLMRRKRARWLEEGGDGMPNR